MAKVLAIHYIELKPGANAEALERFLVDHPFQTLPGWKTYFVKGERGERKNQFALIHEFESVEIRDKYFPTEAGEPSPEVQRLFSDPKIQALGAEWDKLATSLLNTVSTDYVVLG